MCHYVKYLTILIFLIWLSKYFLCLFKFSVHFYYFWLNCFKHFPEVKLTRIKETYYFKPSQHIAVVLEAKRIYKLYIYLLLFFGLAFLRCCSFSLSSFIFNFFLLYISILFQMITYVFILVQSFIIINWLSLQCTKKTRTKISINSTSQNTNNTLKKQLSKF